MTKEIKTKNIWSIVCQKALVDSQTQLVSLIDIVEKLIVDIDINKAPEEVQKSFKNGVLGNPIQIANNITVASYWSIQKDHEEKDFVLETTVKDSNERALLTTNLEIKPKRNEANHKTFVNLPGIAITGSGIYTIESSLIDTSGLLVAKGKASIIIEFNNIPIK